MVGRSLASGGGSSTRRRAGVGSSLGGVAAAAPSEGKAPGPSILMRTLAALDTGRRGVTAVVKELDDLLPGTKGDRAKSDGFSLGDIGRNYRANEGRGIGAGDLIGGTGNKWADRAIGLAGDIALDPLSYMTLGVGTAAKKAAAGGARVAGKATAKDVAREALAKGDRELADRVMSRGLRGSTNAMTAAEAAEYGIRQGATIGVGKTRAALPGGDKVARAVSNVLAPATEKVAKLPLNGLGNAVKNVSPVERMIARDANRALRLAAKGTRQRAIGQLNQVLQETPDFDSQVVRDAMEGVTAGNPTAERITQTLDEVHAWASQQLGRELPRRENYLSHRLTEEARAAKIEQGGVKRTGKTPTVMKSRGWQAGDTFFGETLKDGSISEMNAIMEKVGGRKMWEDDPIKIAHMYIEDLTRMVARSEEAFATEAIARTGVGGAAPVKEVAAPGARAAAREARQIEKLSARVADELDKVHTELKGAKAGAIVADDAAQRLAGEANKLGARLAIPESAPPGLLATLPDLASRRAALVAAAGRDTTVATQELIDLTGARRLDGETVLGEQAFAMPSGVVVPERNILSHADAQLQVADLKERALAAREEVAAKLRPEARKLASTTDHVYVTRDAEALLDEAAENGKSLDALRVMRHKASQEALVLREEAARLYDAAAAARAAGDDELANVAALAAQAAKMQADLTNLDRSFEKALRRASDVRFVEQHEVMIKQGLMELADGRYAEPWVAEAAKQIADAMTPANVGRLVKEFDRISGFWRASALLSPGYHMRNFYGAMFNNSLAGMDWGRYKEYLRTAKQYKAGGLDAIPDKQVREAWRAAEANGLLKGEDISDVSKIIGDQGGKIVGRQNPLFRLNFRAAERVEAAARVPLFVDAFVKSGGDVDSALDTVMKYHFDYEDLSKMEREVGRRAFGFYTWARNNMPLMVSEMADKPGKFTRFAHLKRNIELGQEEDPQKPGYFNKLMAVAIPGAKWKGGDIYWAPDLPFISAAGTAGEGSAGMLANLNPLIKTPLESITNRKFFEDRNFSDTLRPGPTDPAFGTVLQVLAKLPKNLPGVPQVYKGDDGSVLIDEREMNKIESLLPMLSRLRRLYPTEEKYQGRALTSWLSFAFGIGARTLDDSMRGGEMKRRSEAAKAEERRSAKIKGGRTLADYEAAQRQAKAIQLAQEGR